jgi:hypothetical protein
LISARRELLAKLLALQEEVQLQLISPEELLLIQQMWTATRAMGLPDDLLNILKMDGKRPCGKVGA